MDEKKCLPLASRVKLVFLPEKSKEAFHNISAVIVEAARKIQAEFIKDGVEFDAGQAIATMDALRKAHAAASAAICLPQATKQLQSK